MNKWVHLSLLVLLVIAAMAISALIGISLPDALTPLAFPIGMCLGAYPGALIGAWLADHYG